jgi:hypothetical protein
LVHFPPYPALRSISYHLRKKKQNPSESLESVYLGPKR